MKLLTVLLCLFSVRLYAQGVRIASLDTNQLGGGPRDYLAVARTLSHFDVVAAARIADSGGAEKLLAGLEEGWEAQTSEGDGARRGGLFGFFYNERVEIVKMLGAYPRAGQFARPPYGVQFRLRSSRLLFNLVAYRIETTSGAKGDETRYLGVAYRYFENLTGNRGITIMAGNVGGGPARESRSTSSFNVGEVYQVGGGAQAGSASTGGYGPLFLSAALRPRVREGGIYAGPVSAVLPRPAYVVLTAVP